MLSEFFNPLSILYAVPSAYIWSLENLSEIEHSFCTCHLFIPTECPLVKLESDEIGLKVAVQSMRRVNKGWNHSRWEVWLQKIMTSLFERAMAVDPEVILEKHNFGLNDYSQFQSKTTDWGTPLDQVVRTRYLKRALPGSALGAHVYFRLADDALKLSLACSDALR